MFPSVKTLGYFHGAVFYGAPVAQKHASCSAYWVIRNEARYETLVETVMILNEGCERE
jgi:hypothetical protein